MVTVHTEKKLSDRRRKILEYARKHGAITRNDVIGLLEVSASTAARVIRKMVKTNLLEQNGKARNTQLYHCRIND
ncbi:MAG: winged helix-turn-helix transcriptional regulator [Blautia massiliensis (ex Durand et al. 2017)]